MLNTRHCAKDWGNNWNKIDKNPKFIELMPNK